MDLIMQLYEIITVKIFDQIFYYFGNHIKFRRIFTKKGRKNLKIKLNNIIHHDFNNKIVINKKILFILKLKPKLVYTNYKFAKKSDKLKDELNNVLIY